MKKFLPLIVSALWLNTSVYAQNKFAEPSPNPGIEIQSSVTSDRALWDVQLDIDPTTISAGLAGVCWTGTEFWVSRWANDTLYTANASGSTTAGPFVVPGVTGVRSITTDGTNLYMGANTSSIFKVDPVSKTLISTITTSLTNVRYVTYDASLDGGAGGFWIGTWATDITAVSMSGATLSSISASNHGLTGIYGIAHDSYSAGGPYIWAYDQTSAGGVAKIYQLDMTGTPTGQVHDTQLDLAGGTTTGASGGLFISSSFVPGKKTIGGIMQGASLFAYELSDPTGLEDNQSDVVNVTVWPNPASENLFISAGGNEINSYFISDLTGRVISQSKLSGVKICKQDISNLPAGLYLLNILTNQGIKQTKFAVK